MTGEHTPGHVVLLSGGLDSAVACAWSLARRTETVALTVRGEDRLDVQTRCAQRLAEHFDIRIDVVTAPFLSRAFRSLDSGLRGARPDGWDSLPLLADLIDWTMLAAALAERLGLSMILLGLNRENSATASIITEPLLVDIERVLTSAGVGGISVQAPFLTWTKNEVVRVGSDLSVPFELTWSCEHHGALHCGSCSHCVARQEAFRLSGVTDIVKYADPLVIK